MLFPKWCGLLVERLPKLSELFLLDPILDILHMLPELNLQILKF